eukprot:Skav216729  [mRNA]  locus=scaffold653:109436:129336:+ [translate_table: standard]
MAEIIPSDEHPAVRESETFLGCAYCNEAFAEKRELEVHIKMQHPGMEYKCVPAPMPKREQGLLKKAPSMAISRNIPLSEVNRHCIPEDCWVALNGKVYDLSEFMDRHPGGPTTIVAWAGKDASKFFNDIHKGVKIDSYLRPEAWGLGGGLVYLVALNGSVYDLTDFLTHHPEQRNAILAWAGRDATPVWNKIPGRSSTPRQGQARRHRAVASISRLGSARVPLLQARMGEGSRAQDELWKLEGPSAAEIAAAKAAAQKVPGTTETPTEGEEARFPKLKDLLFRHCWVPKAVEHLADMLVGQLLPAEAADWSAEATGGQAMSSEERGYLRYKAYDVVLGADKEQIKDNGATAILLAAEEGKFEVARFLVESGAESDRASDSGATPLHSAAYGGHIDIVKLLVEAGANKDRTTQAGATPLSLSSQQGHIKVVRCLLEAGASTNQGAIDGATPLYAAVKGCHLDVASLLVEFGSATDQAADDGTTPLFIAAASAQLDMARLLLQAGAPINFALKNGATALLIAAQEGHLGVVQLLVEVKALIDQGIDDGATPLHFAVQEGHLNIAQALVEAGASKDQQMHNGATPLFLAVERGHLEIARFLLKCGASKNQATEDSATPLFVASATGQLDMARILIAAGAATDMALENGATALHVAARGGNLDMVRLLIDAGADNDLAIETGETAIDLAGQEGHEEVVHFLKRLKEIP